MGKCLRFACCIALFSIVAVQIPPVAIKQEPITSVNSTIDLSSTHTNTGQ